MAAGPAAGSACGRRGVFLKLIPGDTQGPQPVFAARRLAWYPDEVDPNLGVNFGMTVLGDLGMDVGLWDQVENRKPLTVQDREPFFQLLRAVDQTGARQLVRLARQHLATLTSACRAQQQQLAQQLAELSVSPDQVRGRPTAQPSRAQQISTVERQLAQLRRDQAQAQRGTSSVVPLFNEPNRQFGQLVVVDGTARRTVKIYLTEQPAPSAAGDRWPQSGMDHYYELELFTDDSQNNPIVFCVRRVPVGFPLGADIFQPVRIAGFFFKSWAYPAWTRAEVGAAADPAVSRRWQLAPLLVGREPIRLTAGPPVRYSYLGLLAGGLFMLLLAATWYGLWRYDRGDRRFDTRTRAARSVGDLQTLRPRWTRKHAGG